jgi:DNA-binding CsgD family transcriptional regulator
VLVGRGAETATIDGLLASAREGRSRVLVVRGDAGVGKSALLAYAALGADGFIVLRGTGIESESELAFAALHQILRSVLDRLDRLPGPQADALRAAFALSNETVEDRFRISLGVLGLLSEVAEERPVLCLVDDAQWLDQASADALVFAALRLEAERIVLLFAARDDASRRFTAAGLPELRPPPLEPGDARSLVAERLGPQVPFAVVEWLVASANGNPLAVIELPSALSAGQLEGREPLEGALPPPTSVEQVYLERVERLPPRVRDLLVVAACEETGDRASVVKAAAELGLDPDELSVAEGQGLVRVGRDRIEFSHPLMRSAVYRGAGFVEREGAHRALAAVLSGSAEVDRRAWHRASATVGMDDEVASDLEATAERARSRGGPGAAVAALERAAELTADPETSGRRLVLAARAAWHGGQPERATGLLDRAAAVAAGPELRAERDHLRGLIQLRCGSLLESAAILVAGAAEVAPRDPRMACVMLLDAGSAAAKSGDIDRLVEVARRAAALPRTGDPLLALRLDLLEGVGSLAAGRSSKDVPLVRDAISRAGAFHDPQLLSWAAVGAAAVGDEATEAALLRQAVTVARDSRAVDTLVFVLETAVNAGMLAGRYAVEAEATEGLRLAREAGLSNAATSHLAALAWLSALRGRDDECRAQAEEVTAAARPSGLGNASSVAEWALALLDLGLGRPAEAAARLTELRTAPRGHGHPMLVLNSTPDLVEASVRADRVEQAKAAFALYESYAKPRAPAWTLALAARCRGLLLEGEEAERAFQDALRLHAKAPRPFDRARTELVYGEFLRREKRRVDAREQLRAALADFEHLRAVPWADRARTELRATGETIRKRDASTRDELTPQELQIAELVGQGHSNREVASQLFLSPRTVEYHLRKVFAKLGISSRAELIRDARLPVMSPS